MFSIFLITKICQCNIQTFFSTDKLKISLQIVFIFLSFLLKTLIVRQGGSNEHTQSMFWINYKKNMFTPA